MFRSFLAVCIALVAPTQAAPTYPGPNITQRDASTATQLKNHQMSSEAIIGIAGVIVSLLGIAASLVWARRRKLRVRGYPRVAASSAQNGKPPSATIGVAIDTEN